MRRVLAGAATSLSRAGALATSRPPAIAARVHNGVRLLMPAPRETNASRVPVHGGPTGREVYPSTNATKTNDTWHHHVHGLGPFSIQSIVSCTMFLD